MTEPKDPADSNLSINVHELSVQMPVFQPQYVEPNSGRNAQCPCGSGKKYKKCHGVPGGTASSEKTRQQKLTFMFSQPLSMIANETNQLSVKVDPWSKNIEIISHGEAVVPSEVKIERNYERTKGPKVTTTAIVDGSAPHFDFRRALSQYALCFGVDTNTRNIGGELVSVTGTTTFDPSQDPSRTQYIYPGIAFEYRGTKASPEKLGWLAFIHAFMKSPNFSVEKRYCLVVDSHLEELPAINRREQPILEGQILPAHFDLAYASADTGNNIQNRLIKYADRSANDVFELIEAGREFTNLEHAPDNFSDARRIWDVQALVNNGTLSLIK